MMKKFVLLLLTAAFLISLTAPLSAIETGNGILQLDVFTYGSAEAENSVVRMQRVNGENYLFLPSGMSAGAASLYFLCSDPSASYALLCNSQSIPVLSGQPVDLLTLFGEKAEYPLTVQAKTASAEATLSLRVVPTNGIGSMFLVSDDPAAHGRTWVESSPDKTNKASGSLFMQSADGSTVYDGALTQIKGRGNSTWLLDKKPYQIKLDKKTDLLQTGNSANKAKTWVLLADAVDPSLLRNNIVYDLSVAAGLKPGIESEPVNLFYDGEYRGAYLLCEKVEINSGRIDIADLEKETENTNPDITDFDSLPVSTATTENGAAYTYCGGITDPADLSGGYLLEMETGVRAVAEKCYFITARKNYIVVKSPEYCSKEEMDYIASHYQEFENTLYNKGVNPANGKPITDYITIESLASTYLVNELTKNPDGYRTSTYLYKDAGSDVMTMGPIWDYDLSFGLSFGDFIESASHTDGLFSIYSHIGKNLYEIPEFRQAVHDIYLEKFFPLISDVLVSGSAEAAPMQSFSAYCTEIGRGAHANGILWGISDGERNAQYDALLRYISARNVWLEKTFASWSAETFTPLAHYADVREGEWYYEEVTKATDYGILNGMANGIFSPNGDTTRAQAAKVLYALSGSQETGYSPVFTDVTSDAWYTPAVMWASKNQIVLGHEDHTFRPEGPVTRQDFIVMVYRRLGSPSAGTDTLKGFADSSAVASYARQALIWAINAGLLRGYEDNTIRPENRITRAELAALTVRLYETFLK